MNTTKFDKCFIHLTNGTTVEYRNGELGFYDGLLSIWGDIYDGTVTSPTHDTYKREEYEKVEVA